MTVPNLEDRLAAMQAAFKDASDPSSNFELPPDGDYQALVNGFDFLEFNDVAFLKTELQIHNDPEYTGSSASTMHNLEDPDKIGWLKKHLAILGVNVEHLDLTEVRPGSATLSAVLDTPVEITIKTGSRINQKTGEPYRNVYVNRSLGAPLAGTTSQAKSTQVADDSVPF